MSYDKISSAVAHIAAGPVAGESLQGFRQAIQSLGQLPEGMLQQATIDTIALGNSESHIGQFIAHNDLEIVAVYAVKQGGAGAAATATLVNRDASGDSDKNPLSGTNIDMSGLTTANEPESQALSSTEANIQMDAGDCLKCTFACDGASTLTGGAVSIVYKLR